MAAEPEEKRVNFQFELQVGGTTLKANAEVSAGPTTTRDLLPILQSFDEAVVSIAVKGVEKAGRTVSCKAGCGACCRQLVPISEPEARHLANLVQNMPAERRAIVESRFRDALAKLKEADLDDRLRVAPGLTKPDAMGRLARDYFAAGVACPFLEDESCSIHPDRPLTCREYLVTSPAENCADRERRNITRVPLPVKVSGLLYHLDESDPPKQAESSHWLPLVRALEWAAEQTADEPTCNGPDLFEHMLKQIHNACQSDSDQNAES